VVIGITRKESVFLKFYLTKVIFRKLVKKTSWRGRQAKKGRLIWSYYDRLEKTEEELFDDDTVIYDLVVTHKELENDSYQCTAIYSNKEDVKVGTIDKFQGQEAPVVIVSMGVSSVENSPRGLDFIFNVKRLNVAVSRAQTLAIVVDNKQLDTCRITSLEQMEKAAFYGALKLC
jgi:hypothetical protein